MTFDLQVTKLNQVWYRKGIGMAAKTAVQDHSFRSACAIARTLEIVGDKWTLLIVRDLMWHDKHTFQALQHSAETMPTNILAERLRRLQAWGLVEKRPYQERPVRYEYRLTDKGRTMEPVLKQIMRWGHEQLGGGFYAPPTA